MPAVEREVPNVGGLEAGVGPTAGDRTPVGIGLINRSPEPSLTHARTHEDGRAVLRAVPLDLDTSQVGVPDEVDPGSPLQELEGLQDVLRVRLAIWADRFVTLDRDVVRGPVRRLGEFIARFGEEDVPENDATDRRVGLRLVVLRGAVGLHPQEELLLAVGPVPAAPNCPGLADRHLEVLLEEATADKGVARHVQPRVSMRAL